MPQPNIGGITPPGDGYLAGRLRELERQVAELRTARTVAHTTISDGVLQVVQNGVVVVELGLLSSGVGSGMWRPDGTLAFTVANGYVALVDKAGNVIVSDDTISGRGLATPWLGHTLPTDTDTTKWPQSASGSWTPISQCYTIQQNPGLYWAIYVGADTGTSGQIRIKLDGTVIATSPSVSASFSVWTAAYYYPAGWAYGNVQSLSIEALVTSGSGKVRAETILLAGRQS